MRYFILVYLFFCASAQAQLTEICLQNAKYLRKAKSKVSEILHSQDQVFLRESVGCLEFVTTPKRADLYNNYLRSSFALKNRETNSQVSQTKGEGSSALEQCRFTMIEESWSNLNKQNFQFGRGANARAAESLQKQTSRSNILVQEGKWASLRMEDRSAFISCRKQGDSYEIEVSLSADGSSLSTSLSLSKGQRVNIGDIVKNLSGGNASISLNNGLEKNTNKGVKTVKYYLVLN